MTGVEPDQMTTADSKTLNSIGKEISFIPQMSWRFRFFNLLIPLQGAVVKVQQGGTATGGNPHDAKAERRATSAGRTSC